MAAVQVTVHNNSDQKVTLTLDDETDAERIEYFETLKRRGDIQDVSVKKPAAARGKSSHSDAGKQDAGDAGDAS